MTKKSAHYVHKSYKNCTKFTSYLPIISNEINFEGLFSIKSPWNPSTLEIWTLFTIANWTKFSSSAETFACAIACWGRDGASSCSVHSKSSPLPGSGFLSYDAHASVKQVYHGLASKALLGYGEYFERTQQIRAVILRLVILQYLGKGFMLMIVMA